MNSVTHGQARQVSLRTVRDATRAALDNEALTRQRVESLELWVATWMDLTFWQWLRWVLFGR